MVATSARRIGFGFTSGAVALLLEAALACRYLDRPPRFERLGKPHLRSGAGSQERALASYRKALGPQHPYVSSHLGSIARSLMNAGRLDEAVARMEEALAIALQTGENTSDVITFRNALGAILIRAKRYDEALPQLEKAVAACEAVLAADAPQLADTRTGDRGAMDDREASAAICVPPPNIAADSKFLVLSVSWEPSARWLAFWELTE